MQTDDKIAIYEKAIRKAVSLIDVAMGDTDPPDEDDPLLVACQTLVGALDAAGVPLDPS